MTMTDDERDIQEMVDSGEMPEEPADIDNYLTIERASAFISEEWGIPVEPKTLYNRMSAGTGPEPAAWLDGRRMLFTRECLRRWMSSRITHTKAAADDEAAA